MATRNLKFHSDRGNTEQIASNFLKKENIKYNFSNYVINDLKKPRVFQSGSFLVDRYLPCIHFYFGCLFELATILQRIQTSGVVFKGVFECKISPF